MARQELRFGAAKNVDNSVTNTNSIKQIGWQDGLLWVGAARGCTAGMTAVAAV